MKMVVQDEQSCMTESAQGRFCCTCKFFTVFGHISIQFQDLKKGKRCNIYGDMCSNFFKGKQHQNRKENGLSDVGNEEAQIALLHNKKKGSFYIAQYPVRWTAQSAVHFLPPLADLFIPTPTRLLREAF